MQKASIARGKKPLKSHQICPSLILNHTETSNKLCGKFCGHNLNMIQSREHSRIWEITRHCIELWPLTLQILIAEKLILLLSILLWTSVAKRNLAENFFFLFWFFLIFWLYQVWWPIRGHNSSKILSAYVWFYWG